MQIGTMTRLWTAIAMTAVFATVAVAESTNDPQNGASQPTTSHRIRIVMKDGAYQATIDTSESPELTAWAQEELAPVVGHWYPKIVALLPSEGYEAPRKFRILFTPRYHGVAATAGTRIVCNPKWFRDNLKGEAKGAVVHEMVHVVQRYKEDTDHRGDAVRPPGWLVEGIPDYIRWFLYEPETHGAEISKRRIATVKYDDSYRVSGNFLNWVTNNYDDEIVLKLNAALRDGHYEEKLWSDYTGRTLAELGSEWKSQLAEPVDNKSSERTPVLE